VRPLFVDEDRDGPAPLADRGSDLRYLFIGMSSGITGVGDELREWPALDLIRRPGLPLARGRARIGGKLAAVSDIIHHKIDGNSAGSG